MTNPCPHRRLRRSFSWSAAVLVALAVGLISGCDGGDRGQGVSTSDNPNAEAEFVFANRGKVSTLDPNQMSWMQDIRIAQTLFEGIYSLDPVTLDTIYGAAEEVTHDDTFTQWTIRLKENAKWSNGDPHIVDDFIFSWRRMMEQPGYYSYLVNDYIKGAGA